MSKILKVPVRFGGGILHDTAYHRGADSLTELLNERDRAMHEDSHTKWAPSYYWAIVPPFKAQIRLVGHERSRSGSAVWFKFEDQAGSHWPMNLADAAEFFQDADLSNGWSRALTFEVVKRGTAYGIRVVK